MVPWILLTSLIAGATVDSRLALCEAKVREHPREYSSWVCYWLASRGGDSIALAAEQALAAKLRLRPQEPRALLYLAMIRSEREESNVAAMFEEAAQGFRAEGAAEGEIYSLIGLIKALDSEQGRFDLGASLHARAERLAASLRRKDLQAMVAMSGAEAAMATEDVGAAIRYLWAAESLVAESGPDWLRRMIRSRRALFELNDGRYRESLASYRSLAEWPRPLDEHSRAVALGGMATSATYLALAGSMTRPEARARVDLAQDAAERVDLLRWGSIAGSLPMHRLRAMLLGPTDEGIAELQRAIREPAPGGNVTEFLLLARFTVDRDVRRAQEATDYANRAMGIARTRHWKPEQTSIEVLLTRAEIRRQAGLADQALEDEMAALAGLERLRTRQPDQAARVQLGSRWAWAYRLIAAHLLQPTPSPGSTEAARAFQVMERFRARTLHELLTTARAEELGAGLRDRGADIRGRITQTQRTLQQRQLTPTQRAVAEDALDAAEAEESAWLDEVARSQKPIRLWDSGRTATLESVQASLREDEALLSFQTWTRSLGEPTLPTDGSSWVLAITRGAVRAARIPDAEILEPMVRSWTGLFDRDDEAYLPGAVRLHQLLLAEVLDGLPPGVRRLIIVPDGPLHRLPFDALRATPRSPVLGQRFSISLAPSASLWLHWRTFGVVAPQRGALALADPPAAPGDAGALGLAALPFARQEAMSAVKGFPGTRRVLFGPEASERWVKTSDLSQYILLHFGTHAVIDTAKPARSALVLAPGADEEDGLLQVREIAMLDLSGKLIVLSACQSADGALLQGEGVMSLARAFFEAGAIAVVGSLWPVHDDEAAALLGAFYRKLSDGASVDESLAQARRARMLVGAAPSAWAGWVVVGDGRVAPVRVARSAAGLVLWLLALAAIALGAIGAQSWRLGRSRHIRARAVLEPAESPFPPGSAGAGEQSGRVGPF